MRIEGDVAFIENRILCNAIWGDYSCTNPVPDFTGYVQANTDPIGRAFIEYCIARVLGIYRLPQCGYDNYTYGWCKYDTLPPDEVEEACVEMEKVINHVQTNLRTSPKVVNGKISVVRCLSNFQMMEVAQQLADDTINEIEFPISILSSYSYDGDITTVYPRSADSYGRHINIRESVPLEDIVYWDRYVGNGRRGCAYLKTMNLGENELWVADRSINGRRKLKRDSFSYVNGLPNYSGKYCNHRYGKDTSIYRRPNISRPCEYNGLTRHIIKWNMKRMEKDK